MDNLAIWQNLVDKIKERGALLEADYNQLRMETSTLLNKAQFDYTRSGAERIFLKLQQNPTPNAIYQEFITVGNINIARQEKKKEEEIAKQKEEEERLKNEAMFIYFRDGISAVFHFGKAEAFINHCYLTRGQSQLIRIPFDTPNLKVVLSGLREILNLFDKEMIVELTHPKRRNHTGKPRLKNQQVGRAYEEALASGASTVCLRDGMSPEDAIESKEKVDEWLEYIKSAEVNEMPLTPYEKYLMAYNMASRSTIHPKKEDERDRKKEAEMLKNAENMINLFGRAGLLKMLCDGLGIKSQLILSEDGPEKILFNIVDAKYNLNGNYVATPSLDYEREGYVIDFSNQPARKMDYAISSDTELRAQTVVNMALDQSLSMQDAKDKASTELRSTVQNQQARTLSSQPTLKK